MADTWNAKLYDTRHGFVSSLASDLVDLLAPLPGERVIDLGCGTGTLANVIASRGAEVLGLDASATMIEQARAKFPQLQLEVADARTFVVTKTYDAIFSNATLHWVRPPEQAIAQMNRALRNNGRLVVEFGGHGNVRHVLESARDAGSHLGVDLSPHLDINYFPSLPEYTSLLEAGGFEVTFATLFDRPTRLDDGARGLENWYRMFRPGVFDLVPTDLHGAFISLAQEHMPTHLHDGETWLADYRRLRVVAHKVG